MQGTSPPEITIMVSIKKWVGRGADACLIRRLNVDTSDPVGVRGNACRNRTDYCRAPGVFCLCVFRQERRLGL